MKKTLAIALVLAACLILAIGGPASAKTTFISIGTGGTGGVYYPYGGGLAEIWTKNVPGVKAVAEVTGASVENVKLAHKGETVIGEVMGDVAVSGYTGKGKLKKKHKILGMGIMYPNLMQVVALKKSGIKNIADIKGKVVSTGSPGSGTNFMAEAVMKALGIDMGDIKRRRLSFNENANALRDGTIDVGFWVVAPGTSSIMDLSTTHDIQVLNFTPEQQAKVKAANPTYSDVVLKGGTYRGADVDVQSVGVWNVIICQRDLDEGLVYNLVKAMYENQDYLVKIHPSAGYTTPENAVKYSPIPLHPGMIKYLKEKGIEVPARLIP